MGEYHVHVDSGDDTDCVFQEAYSPVEAAFLVGLLIGAETALLDARGDNDLFHYTAHAAAGLLVKYAKEEISSVLVEEVRYNG